RDSFPAKIVKGLAFTPLTDIRRFVTEYLLDENLVDVKTLQAQLETLRHFEELAADIRERIAALTQIAELDQERIANRRRRITNGCVRRRAEADTHLTALKARRLELDETRLELSRAALRRDELTEQFKHAQSALVDAQVALQTDTTAIREKELREKISALAAELKELRERETRLNETLAREAQDAQKLRDLLIADNRPVPPALDEFIGNPQSAIRNLQSAIESLGHEYAAQDALVAERARVLREEAAQIEGEIRSLKTGDRETGYEAATPEAARLRRLLRAELGLSADDVIFLCTALQVPDESWQDAVEGVLGRNRFTLLVPPAHYDAAMRLYRERRHKENLHGVGLLDSERIVRAVGAVHELPLLPQHELPQRARSDSLAAEVQTA
ncbi:MAG: hypothetical protein AAB342_01155, partial [Chloroflexota bacterium]